MPDLTPFWISIRVAVISTIIVTVLGILYLNGCIVVRVRGLNYWKVY